MKNKTILTIVFGSFINLFFTTGLFAAECKQIMFPKGAVSTAINGVTKPDGDGQCYKITTAANQTAKISITSTNNVTAASVYNIDNPNDQAGGDDRLKFEFRTEKGTYKISVFQDTRSPVSDPYTLFVEVR